MNRKNGNYKSKQTSKMAAVFDKNNIKKMRCVAATNFNLDKKKDLL